MPEAPKPNRRRAVVFCTAFALVLGGVIYYLWTNHAYLKWRFAGSEVGLMGPALEPGQISPGQLVALVTKGATPGVRIVALRLVGSSRKFAAPYDDRIIEAIHVFAADIPGGEKERPYGARAVARAIGASGRPELFGILEALAADTDPAMRAGIPWAFGRGTDFGEAGRARLRELAKDQTPEVRQEVATALMYYERAPDWAVSIVRGLLDDADPRVRFVSVGATRYVLQEGKGTEFLPSRLREILDSSEEDHRVRALALEVLHSRGLVRGDELAAFAGDPQERVAQAAKNLMEMREVERDAERAGPAQGD